MKLKNGLMIIVLLFIGGVFAQEKTPREPELKATPAVITENKIVDFPDVEAMFPGGSVAMRKFIQENVQYPEKAKENGDRGRVYVSFVIEKNGTISNVELKRGGLTPELNAEAKRLIRIMPPWKPGEVRGKAVRCRCLLPVTFVLTGLDDK